LPFRGSGVMARQVAPSCPFAVLSRTVKQDNGASVSLTSIAVERVQL